MPYGVDPENHGSDMSDLQGCAAWAIGMLVVGFLLAVFLYTFVWSP